MRSVLVTAGAFALSGCRIGGPGADPYAELELPDAATPSGGHSDEDGTGGTVSADPGGGAGAGQASTGGVSPSDGSGGATAAGGTAAGGSAIVTGDGASAGTNPPPGDCQAPAQLAVCDPVKNTGCLVPFSFCDIDPMQAVPGGRCVFPPQAAPSPAAPCEVTSTSETCWPMSTCVNGACRKLCYCDTDCSAGECCGEPAPGAAGVFRLCKPC